MPIFCALRWKDILSQIAKLRARQLLVCLPPPKICVNTKFSLVMGLSQRILTCLHACFFRFCPLCWPPLFLTFSGNLFACSPPQNMLCLVEQTEIGEGQFWYGPLHKVWEGNSFPKSARKKVRIPPHWKHCVPKFAKWICNGFWWFSFFSSFLTDWKRRRTPNTNERWSCSVAPSGTPQQNEYCVKFSVFRSVFGVTLCFGHPNLGT